MRKGTTSRLPGSSYSASKPILIEYKTLEGYYKTDTRFRIFILRETLNFVILDILSKILSKIAYIDK